MACTAPAAQVPSNPSQIPAATVSVSPSPPAVLPTKQPDLDSVDERSCDGWPAWPVIPHVADAIRAVYERGGDRGNNPRAFSKIGDGEIAADWFLSVFDLDAQYYDLGPHTGLLPMIEYFQGSFGRRSAAARAGFNTQRILDPAQRDHTICAAGESPLECELRLHRPAFAILSLGTNQVWRQDDFEVGMRRILDILLASDVVPVLSTKGDNLEGDHQINRLIACLALEYNVPLWNFWAAIQPLPNHGLQPDREHLTYGIADFDDARAMQSAWTVRNLTALQTLDALWREVVRER